MPSRINDNIVISISRLVVLDGLPILSNDPSSSLLYQMQKPVLSQKSILHLSPRLLKYTNKWPLNGSWPIMLFANIESLLNPQRMSAGWVYMNIRTEDGRVSINLPGTKQKWHCSRFCCLLWNLFAMCGPRKAEALRWRDRSSASRPLWMPMGANCFAPSAVSDAWKVSFANCKRSLPTVLQPCRTYWPTCRCPARSR